MTGKQSLDLLMGRLGYLTDPQLRASALLEMVMIQQTVLEMGPYIPWFCASETVTAVITASERRVALPADFLREMEDSALWVLDSSGQKEAELEKADFDDLVTEWGMDATGETPLNYALLGEYLHLFPIPTVSKSILMKHYRRQITPADDNVETPWLKNAPDLMIAATGRVITRQYRRDEGRAQGFATEMTEAWNRLHVFEVARNEANRMRQMG